jgi:hypothetical protein
MCCISLDNWRYIILTLYRIDRPLAKTNLMPAHSGHFCEAISANWQNACVASSSSEPPPFPRCHC